jgi:hypothetical protein
MHVSETDVNMYATEDYILGTGDALNLKKDCIHASQHTFGK